MPQAPQKFKEFIDRFGTHYVHSAEFGGKLRIYKEKVVNVDSDLDTLKTESQNEFDFIVGQATTKNRMEDKSKGFGGGAQAQIKGGGVDIGGGFSGSDSSQDTLETTNTANSGVLLNQQAQIANNALKAEKFRRTSTRTDLQVIVIKYNYIYKSKPLVHLACQLLLPDVNSDQLLIQSPLAKVS